VQVAQTVRSIAGMGVACGKEHSQLPDTMKTGSKPNRLTGKLT
jgi:hypothetical protein